MVDKSFGGNVITVNLMLLKFSGVLPSSTKFLFFIEWTNVLATISFLCLSIYSISYTYEFIAHAIHADVALEFFSMIISFIGGQTRYVILLAYRVKFQKMLRLCEGLWSKLEISEKGCIERYTNKAKRLTYYYLFGCAFTIFFYAIASLFVPSPNTDEMNSNETIQRNLPYAFIIEIHQSPYFEIAYVVQLASMINVGLTCVGVDTVGPLLVLTACGHLKVIRTKILSLMENNKFENSLHESREQEFCTFEDVQANIASYARYHGTILEFCEDIEELTNIIFLTQLIGSTYNISLVGFKLTGDDPDKYKYTTQVSIAVIQLFLCNWPPDVLLSESAAVANSAYFVPWYTYSSSLRKSVYIMIMRSQRAVRLTAGKFTSLSLETFASMISTAVSFFTVINSMN